MRQKALERLYEGLWSHSLTKPPRPRMLLKSAFNTKERKVVFFPKENQGSLHRSAVLMVILIKFILI